MKYELRMVMSCWSQLLYTICVITQNKQRTSDLAILTSNASITALF